MVKPIAYSDESMTRSRRKVRRASFDRTLPIIQYEIVASSLFLVSKVEKDQFEL